MTVTYLNLSNTAEPNTAIKGSQPPQISSADISTGGFTDRSGNLEGNHGYYCLDGIDGSPTER
jgi:hypothetical protein